MSLIVIPPIILCGYFYCHIHNYLKIKIEKKYGQYLYLTYFVWGLTFFTISLAIVLCFHNFYDGKFSWRDKSYDIILLKVTIEAVTPFSSESTPPKTIALVIYSTLTSLCLAFLVATAHNIFTNWKYNGLSQYQFRRKIVSDNPEMLMLTNSAIAGDPLLFTLSSGKIYVGQLTDIPVSTGNSLETSSNLTIYPIKSGYRLDDHTIFFTTSYMATNEDSEASEDAEASTQEQPYPYKTSLNRHEISTISYFDMKNYQDLQKSNPTR